MGSRVALLQHGQLRARVKPMKKILLSTILCLIAAYPAKAFDFFVNDAQKRQIIMPALLNATDCIAQRSLARPEIVDAYQKQNLYPVIDAVWSSCQTEIARLVAEHDRLHGFGTGEIFVRGDYREDLPRAILKRIKGELDQRIASFEAADASGKALVERAYECTNTQVATLVSSSDTAELLAIAAMAMCQRDIAAAIDAYRGIFRGKYGARESEALTFGEQLRNTIKQNVIARAVYERARRADSASKSEPATSGNRATSSAPPTPPAPPAGAQANRQQGSYGTGFFVSEQGYVLTNAHVVENCTQPKLHIEDKAIAGRVSSRDEINDLALIVIERKLRPSDLPSFRTGVKLGENVFAFGYPYTDLLSDKGNFTNGSVTAIAGIANDSRMLQISTPVQPGNSGGPLFDESGNVVGVVASKLNAIKVAAIYKDVPQNINFAIRASTAATFLETNGLQVKAGEGGAARSPSEIAERAKKISVLIECEK